MDVPQGRPRPFQNRPYSQSRAAPSGRGHFFKALALLAQGGLHPTVGRVRARPSRENYSDGAGVRKYGSTAPLSLMVMGLPLRSLAVACATPNPFLR